MADALCGPSNSLQSFQKHTSIDRTLQQDRLSTRESSSEVIHHPVMTGLKSTKTRCIGLSLVVTTERGRSRRRVRSISIRPLIGKLTSGLGGVFLSQSRKPPPSRPRSNRDSRLGFGFPKITHNRHPSTAYVAVSIPRARTRATQLPRRMAQRILAPAEFST